LRRHNHFDHNQKCDARCIDSAQLAAAATLKLPRKTARNAGIDRYFIYKSLKLSNDFVDVQQMGVYFRGMDGSGSNG
jgi:hypothetical protein